MDAGAFGAPEPLTLRRVGGDSFVVDGKPPVAVDDLLLYLGPFAVPCNH